jgi:gamma-butyrobetaine dioxygenase
MDGRIGGGGLHRGARQRRAGVSEQSSDPVDIVAAVFDGASARDYLGEPVTVAAHLLQTGALAVRAGASDALVAAALLHDVGHLVGAVSGRELMTGTDNHHGDSGADWLARWFPPAVTEPVRLHVAAKRYLCAVEAGYFDRLSDASRYTLGLQGGTMSAAEVTEFAVHPHAGDAVAVRRWDDEAKDPDADVPGFDHYRPLLRRALSARLRPW